MIVQKKQGAYLVEGFGGFMAEVIFEVGLKEMVTFQQAEINASTFQAHKNESDPTIPAIHSGVWQLLKVLSR